MSETEDRWYVNVGSDDVRMMTLDELVDAFENGVITRETLVVEVGGNEWQPLKEVADLGDEDPVPAAAPASVAPATLRRPPVQQSFPPQAVSRESAWPQASAWPSVVPASAIGRPSSAPLSAIPNSTIPVVQDLDFDIPARSFKSGRKSGAMFALAVVAIAGGVGFAISKSGGTATSPVPVPAAAPVALKDPTPYSSPKEAQPTPTPAKDGDDRLSDDQKKALLTADKDRDDKKRTRAASAPRSGGGGGVPRSGAVFKANGNANDPLNPSL